MCFVVIELGWTPEKTVIWWKKITAKNEGHRESVEEMTDVHSSLEINPLENETTEGSKTTNVELEQETSEIEEPSLKISELVMEVETTAMLFVSAKVSQIELKYKAWINKFKIQEHPIIFINRVLGKSKMNGNIIWEALFGVLFLRLNKRKFLNKK